MRTVLISIFICLLIFNIAEGQFILFPNDTLPLNFPTHLNNTLDNWDSVWAKIKRGGTNYDSLKMSVTDSGQYYGHIVLDAYAPGGYNLWYCGYYSGYTMCDQGSFTVINVDSMQGEAAGLSASEVADTLGNRVYVAWRGLGSNAVVIRCKDLSDSSSIASTQIQVLDSVESATMGLLISDSQGRGFFALDNGTYCVRMYKPGWQFTVPETLNVDGNEDTIYYASAINPGGPLCRVYGWVYNIENDPVEGATIEAQIKTVPVRYSGVVISPYTKSTTTDALGYWYLDIHPNSILTPTTTKYEFLQYESSGVVLRKEIVVPDSSTWYLTW